MKYAFKRQKFLIKQGYNFKMIKESKLPYHNDKQKYNSYKMSSPEAQERYLKKVMMMGLQRQQDKNNFQIESEENEFNFEIKKKDVFNNNKIYIEND
jgi:hypothetical protein